MNLSRLAEEAKARSPEIAVEAQASEKLVRQLQQEIRTASYLLHPPLLDESGLSSALDLYVHGVTERTALAIQLEVPEGFGRVSKELETSDFSPGSGVPHQHSSSFAQQVRNDSTFPR